MTLLFTVYLKKHHIQAQQLCGDPHTRNHHINTWLQQLHAAVEKASAFYPSAYAKLGRCFLEFINKHHLQQPWNASNLQSTLSDIDQKTLFFYKKLTNYAIELSKKSPIESGRPYPNDRKHSGVSISAYVVQETNQHNPEIHGNKYWDTDGFVRHQAIGSNPSDIKEEIRYCVKRSPISRQLSTIIFQNISHFHAEENWFATKLTTFLEYLKTHRTNWIMSKPEDDEIWIQQLKAPTRIEFIISSSPCESCQLLFKNLRSMLNELNLLIPILIFSNTPTNTAEENSQIALVKFNGDYFNTGLIPNTPHAKTMRERNKTCDLVNTFRLFNQETQIFYRFEPIVGQVMPQMMSSSTSPKVRNEFIDDLFNFFGHCSIINNNALPWFICFLRNLPDMPGGFYTSNHMQDWLPIDGHANAYSMVTRVLRETRVKSFLDSVQGNNIGRIDYLRPTLKGSHINTKQQSFTYIADKFQLLLKFYVEKHEKITVLDYLAAKRRLGSFYIKDKNEEDEVPENQYRP